MKAEVAHEVFLPHTDTHIHTHKYTETRGHRETFGGDGYAYITLTVVIV